MYANKELVHKNHYTVYTMVIILAVYTQDCSKTETLETHSKLCSVEVQQAIRRHGGQSRCTAGKWNSVEWSRYHGDEIRRRMAADTTSNDVGHRHVRQDDDSSDTFPHTQMYTGRHLERSGRDSVWIRLATTATRPHDSFNTEVVLTTFQQSAAGSRNRICQSPTVNRVPLLRRITATCVMASLLRQTHAVLSNSS